MSNKPTKKYNICVILRKYQDEQGNDKNVYRKI